MPGEVQNSEKKSRNKDNAAALKMLRKGSWGGDTQS